MKPVSTFMVAMTLTTGLLLAGRLVIGSGAADARPLAQSRGVAILDECRITGRMESRTHGIYAVFDVENPTAVEKDIKLNYLASRMPPQSMVSRMMPRPEVLNKGRLECRVKTGRSTQEVLLKESAPAIPAPATPAAPATNPARVRLSESADLMSAEIWTLVVSRSDITGLHGWGAVGPAASDTLIPLDKGEAVLASTIQEKAAK